MRKVLVNQLLPGHKFTLGDATFIVVGKSVTTANSRVAVQCVGRRGRNRYFRTPVRVHTEENVLSPLNMLRLKVGDIYAMLRLAAPNCKIVQELEEAWRVESL